MTTKAEFLGRIREQVRRTPARFSASSARRPEHPAAEAETIRRELAERWPETLDAFRRGFASVGGVFYEVASVDMVPATVARIAHGREARELVTWHASAIGADLTQALEARGPEAGVHRDDEVTDPRLRRIGPFRERDQVDLPAVDPLGHDGRLQTAPGKA